MKRIIHMKHVLLLAALVGCAAVPAADPTPTQAEYDWRVQVTILRKVTEFCRDADPEVWQDCTVTIMQVFR